MSAHHQYACVKCRSRKIKCDKVVPSCANCADAGVQCIYAARRSRKMQRIPQSSPKPLVPRASSYPSPTSTILLENKYTALDHQDPTVPDDASSDDDGEDIIIPREVRDNTFQCRSDFTQTNHGKLFVAEGRSRYINYDKSKQVVHLASILEAEHQDKKQSLQNGETQKKKPNNKISRRLLPGISILQPNYHIFCPSPESMEILWDYYVCNVDVLVKILYKPTVESLVMNACMDIESLDAPKKCLLFAILFAAVTTMSKIECLRLLKEERSSALSRYRQALDQALAQAEWITSQDIEVLQALILFMVCAPSKNARSTWIMSGIALSIAQAMGMHSDSSNFGLSLVETEIRCRVWWTLCQTDDRISGDCGLEPHVPLVIETKFPLHLNDSDLRSAGYVSPIPRREFTEMTATLAKIKIGEVSLRIKRSKAGHSPMSSSEIESLVCDRIRDFEVYISYLDLSLPLHRLLDLGVRLMVARAWKIVYDQAEQCPKPGGGLNETLVFYNSNVLELTSKQFCGDFCQFSWFFRCRYMQWHAMAYLLIELGKYPDEKGPAVDRAWAILASTFKSYEDALESNAEPFSDQTPLRKSALWSPLHSLYRRTKEARTSLVEKPTQPIANETLANDPFLGIATNFDGDISWDQIDTWLKEIQPDILGEMDLE